MSKELLCHRCGYDLRAHPEDGKCPECGESVAESRRVGAIPLRPAWRESDPRWRRRMLAGAWVLVFLPLMDVLMTYGWASNIPAPQVFDFRSSIPTLDLTLLAYMGIYPFLVFCMGMVMLFSKERGRRRGPLDWTRRWGVMCCYIVMLIRGAGVLFIGALVMVGISALLMSMPLQFQPKITQWFVTLSSSYLLYGPYPHNSSTVVLVAFSSITVLLACVPLYDALRSTDLNIPSAIPLALLTPLALFALMHLAQAGAYWLGISSMSHAEFGLLELYFRPQLLAAYVTALPPLLSTQAMNLFVEATKWGIVLTIAVWLSAAQVAAWRRGRDVKRET